MEPSTCRRNKYGYCKHGAKCNFRHEEEICNDNNCNIFKCDKRHPRNCKWYQDYGRCKFSSYCKFKHVKLDSIEDLVKKIKQNENKLDKSIKNIEKQVLEILGKLEAYEG